jgi:hypothetical protein
VTLNRQRRDRERGNIAMGAILAADFRNNYKKMLGNERHYQIEKARIGVLGTAYICLCIYQYKLSYYI